MEIRTLRRINAALSQAHGPEAVQVPSLSAIVFAERSFVASHEKALIERTVFERKMQQGKKRRCPRDRDDDDDSFFYIRDLKSLTLILRSFSKREESEAETRRKK